MAAAYSGSIRPIESGRKKCLRGGVAESMDAQSSAPLPVPGWRDSRTATLFRSQFRRLWNARTLRLAGWALLGLLAVQLAVGYVIHGVLARSGTSWGTWLYGSSAIGLYSSWTTALYQGLGVLPAGRTVWHFPYPFWLVGLTGLLAVPIQMLAPAFAALSVAPDRENGRMEELLLAGFTPRQILRAKGLAALAPFLVLWLLLEGLTLGMAVYGMFHPYVDPRGFSRPPATWISVATQVLSAFTVVARLGLLVCISALCRRTRTALVACYAVAFLWPVLTQLVFLVTRATSAPDAMQRMWVMAFGGPLLILAALAFCFPRALREIAMLPGDQPPPRRRMRIMEYGAEEPES